MPLFSITNQLPMFLGGQESILLAYLDPGTGSLMLQVLIAGLLSGVFFMKSSFGLVWTSLSRHFK
jgi:hypothetical protein